ncbi:hypothetical protein ROHU_031476 [Labeo rohita]|uniref:Uncharacterized protein n=1 Tax=Labeo rohita TaxID=84645 RepID=A0A498LLG0_LABRO|nr:hypothetical protein ROHU_031476 [Labeo rohita]
MPFLHHKARLPGNVWLALARQTRYKDNKSFCIKSARLFELSKSGVVSWQSIEVDKENVTPKFFTERSNAFYPLNWNWLGEERFL